MSASYPDVLKCSTGERGIELQLDAEKETQLIAKPYPSFIPTIVYNKVKCFINSNDFMKNLMSI